MLELVLDALWGRLVEEGLVSVKGVGFRWAKFPRRCISRETSFESYVRPIEPCQKPEARMSAELIMIKVRGSKTLSGEPQMGRWELHGP